LQRKRARPIPVPRVATAPLLLPYPALAARLKPWVPCWHSLLLCVSPRPCSTPREGCQGLGGALQPGTARARGRTQCSRNTWHGRRRHCSPRRATAACGLLPSGQDDRPWRICSLQRELFLPVHLSSCITFEPVLSTLSCRTALAAHAAPAAAGGRGGLYSRRVGGAHDGPAVHPVGLGRGPGSSSASPRVGCC
jgi:hypothetical protein